MPVIADTVEFAGGVLHAGDVFQLGQRPECIHRDIDDCPAGDVIDNERQIDGLAQRSEMGDQASLARFVVITRRN